MASSICNVLVFVLLPSSFLLPASAHGETPEACSHGLDGSTLLQTKVSTELWNASNDSISETVRDTAMPESLLAPMLEAISSKPEATILRVCFLFLLSSLCCLGMCGLFVGKDEVVLEVLDEEDYWKQYAYEKEPNIFKRDLDLRIASDGGMADVPKLADSMLPKYLRALFIVFCAVFNLILVMTTDLAALSRTGPKTSYSDNDFLVTKWLCKYVLPEAGDKFVVHNLLFGHYSYIVPLTEIVFMSYYLCQTLLYAMAASRLAPRIFHVGDFYMWKYTSDIFWNCLPSMVYCSALRLLHFVSPVVMSNDLWQVGLHAYQLAFAGATYHHAAHGAFELLWFFMTRVFALVLGIDAFLVKFRLASDSIDSQRSDFLSRIHAVTFAWQIMGIICLDWVIKDRLFIFTFGGEDGSLDIDKTARVAVWKAMVSQRIYKEFGSWKGTIIMLAFDDYDMQLLVLDDDEDVKRFDTMREHALAALSSRVGRKTSTIEETFETLFDRSNTTTSEIT